MSEDPIDRLGGPDPAVEADPDFVRALRHRLAAQRDSVAAAPTTGRIVPYLAVGNATRAIEFYATVFGAALVGHPFLADDGRISHAELVFGEVILYLSDEFPETGIAGPTVGEGHAVSLVVHVPDADLCMAAARSAGAKVERPVQDQWRSRSGWFIDPFGHRWSPTSRNINDQQHQMKE